MARFIKPKISCINENKYSILLQDQTRLESAVEALSKKFPAGQISEANWMKTDGIIEGLSAKLQEPKQLIR